MTNKTQAERVELLLKSFMGDDLLEVVPPSDRRIMADLIIHALDSTVEHLHGHLNRAALVLPDSPTLVVMSVVLFKLMQLQCEHLVIGVRDTLAEQRTR